MANQTDRWDRWLSQHILVEIEMPADLDRFRLPEAVDERLQDLLDRQDGGEELTPAERLEAGGAGESG